MSGIIEFGNFYAEDKKKTNNTAYKIYDTEVFFLKLLTLNTHSLEGENYQKSLNDFVDAVIDEKPDIIALQEVNQTKTEKNLMRDELDGMVLIQRDVPVKSDNHAANVARLLEINGLPYNWVWLPIKTGYGKYDEGSALLSISPIEDIAIITASGTADYENGKTRRIPGIKTNGAWFYSVHMGWWDDKDEPFERQWARLNGAIKRDKDVWLMGDFNCRDDVRGEGYDLMRASGWYDTRELAEIKDNGFTVEKPIDGWRSRGTEKMRIDYIWKNTPQKVARSTVIFNGKNKPVISDHYGVMVKTDKT